MGGTFGCVESRVYYPNDTLSSRWWEVCCQHGIHGEGEFWFATKVVKFGLLLAAGDHQIIERRRILPLHRFRCPGRHIPDNALVYWVPKEDDTTSYIDEWHITLSCPSFAQVKPAENLCSGPPVPDQNHKVVG